VSALTPLAAGPNWGSVPDWLAGVGTLLALALALWAVFRELAARREALDDRLRSQARLVAAWVSERDPYGNWAMGGEGFVLTRNGSDEPVRNVTVTAYKKHPSQVPPLEEFYRVTYAVLAPHTTETSRALPFGDAPRFDSVAVSIVFRDSQGCRWQREPDGILQLVARPPVLSRGRRSVKDRLGAWAQGQMDELDS
jgi:hypothetical protein